jgi:ketosteroid isomerase-like protein
MVAPRGLQIPFVAARVVASDTTVPDRRCEMGGALEAATRQYLGSVDRKDVEAIIRAGAEDIQGVDEISRHWMRGNDELGAYIRQLMTMVENVHTSISDVHETELGDIGLVTCWIDQDYTLEGKRQHVSAPTTVAFRRESGMWKVLLFHSVSLPLEEK